MIPFLLLVSNCHFGRLGDTNRGAFRVIQTVGLLSVENCAITKCQELCRHYVSQTVAALNDANCGRTDFLKPCPHYVNRTAAAEGVIEPRQNAARMTQTCQRVSGKNERQNERQKQREFSANP
jgi:hypothetical protein